MSLTEGYADQTADAPSSRAERALLSCRLAKEFEEAGDYGAALSALEGFWPGVGSRPDLEGLDARARAELLLRAGVLTGRLGGEADAAGGLLRESVAAFEEGGDEEGAALASLSLIEEAGGLVPYEELSAAFECAVSRLSDSRQPDVRERLIACARRVIDALASRHEPDAGAEGGGRASSEEAWEGFSLRQEVLRYEGELIARALRDSGGSVSRAAKLLGFKHHNNLVAMLNSRHRELLTERKPIIRRKRSIIPRDKARRRGANA